jgi:hypothetical protein
MSEELKDCPFCGGEAVLHNDARFPQWVGCRKCGVHYDKYKDYDIRHIHEWNARHQSQQPQADEVERVALLIHPFHGSRRSTVWEYEPDFNKGIIRADAAKLINALNGNKE